MIFPPPGATLKGQYDLFKTVDGRKTLVQTSRRCPSCGKPLTGVVIPKGDMQVHLKCPQ